jgi:ammonia channel protein AmtB
MVAPIILDIRRLFSGILFCCSFFFATAVFGQDASPSPIPTLESAQSGSLLASQLAAVGITLVLSAAGTATIALALKFSMGLRPKAEVEPAGLDISEHGEEAYIS